MSEEPDIGAPVRRIEVVPVREPVADPDPVEPVKTPEPAQIPA